MTYWLSVAGAIVGIAVIALGIAVAYSLALAWREHDDDRP